MSRLLCYSVILFLAVINIASTKRIKDMIYMPIDGVSACFRRHNGTHQFGCSSQRGGSVGVIQMLDSPQDLEWLEHNATAGPYSVVMPFQMFTKDVLHRLRATNNINGILLAKNSSHPLPSSYSPDDTCPNRYSGSNSCDSKKPWNPWGSNLLLEDWPFPMFYIQNDTLLQDIRTCYMTHNAHTKDRQKSRSLCSLEMQSFMSAAVDSETCLRRNNLIFYMNPSRFCDPLGDRSIHWPLSPLTPETESMTLIIARLDTNSMFDTIAPGANSAVTSLVTLLATAYHLNSLNSTVTTKNILFSLLNGESFDYIGSSRFVYDLKKGSFNALGGKNLPLSSIKTIIELNQLSSNLSIHTNNYLDNNTLISSLEKSLGANTLQNSVPPSSVQAFLKASPSLQTAVIAGYNEQFQNPYYQGILDNSETLHKTKNINKTLASIAMKLGDALYEHVTNVKSPGGNETFIEVLITQMLSCYLVSPQCSLFHAASAPNDPLMKKPYSLYVGVAKTKNDATILTGQLLALLTGKFLPNMTINECTEPGLAWTRGYSLRGICINSTVNYTSAISPAFIINGYSMKSGRYSTWTESVWQSLSVRMFLKPSETVETLTITLGSVVALLSFVVVWFVNSRAHILFESNRTAQNG